MHLGISEGKGGLKHGSCLWFGMDIFRNCPFLNNKLIADLPEEYSFTKNKWLCLF